MPSEEAMKKVKKINQDKVNKMMLDVIEDIVCNSYVYSKEIVNKTTALNVYVRFGRTMKEFCGVTK